MYSISATGEPDSPSRFTSPIPRKASPPSYGALLDAADGNMITEIAIMDDYFDDNGKPGGPDQRVPSPCYNPNKNEFLVAWRDDRPTLDNYGIMGRFIGSDGTPKGPEFVLLDGPGMQGTIDIEYIEEEKKYFIAWTDTRNATDPGMYYFLSDNADIYARWLDDTGSPIGDEIPICLDPGVQQQPEIAFNPVEKRFLMSWVDSNAPNDYDIIPGASGLFGANPSDVRGTIYGAPAFLTVRVVEQGTGNPVEGARVTVIGLGLLEVETTNVGGWCNLSKDSQRNGRYLIIVWEKGYGMAIRTVTYEGEPLKTTIEVKG